MWVSEDDGGRGDSLRNDDYLRNVYTRIIKKYCSIPLVIVRTPSSVPYFCAKMLIFYHLNLEVFLTSVFRAPYQSLSPWSPWIPCFIYTHLTFRLEQPQLH